MFAITESYASLWLVITLLKVYFADVSGYGKS